MAPIEDGFNGDDFSNNLFTDLAPLLSLFGEQVTKQFLSLSTGWADNVLLAMGPLGIMTVVVSAIRVGGGPWLKALVGRAREEKAVIEQELLSSTSDEICELWNGTSIVRTKGKAPKPMNTLVITDEGRVFDERGAIANGIYEVKGIPYRFREPQPANLTLNLRSPKNQSQERLWLASLGLLLQFAGLAVSGIATKNGAGCNLETKMSQYRKKVAVVRFQAACTVGDQHFPNGAIFNPFDNPDICISKLDMRHRRYLVPVATALTMVGFFIQFIGLRSLHWSASVTQLGITVAMTLVRAFARRGLSKDPPFFRVPTKISLETEELWGGWLAWSLSSVLQDSTGNRIDWKAQWANNAKRNPRSAPGQILTLERCEIESFKGMESISRPFLYVNKTPTTTIRYVQPQRAGLEDAITGTEELQTCNKAMRVMKEVAQLMDADIMGPVFMQASAISCGIFGILKIVKPLRSDIMTWRPESFFLEHGRDDDIHWGIDVEQWREWLQRVDTDGYELPDQITLQSVAISLGLGTESDDQRTSKDIIRQLEFQRYLAAMLRLSRYSLAVGRPGFNIGQVRRKIVRIVGTNPPHPNCKTSLLKEWMNRSLVLPRDLKQRRFRLEPKSVFGMYLSTLSHSTSCPQGPWTKKKEPPRILERELAIFDSEETTYTEQMARELFSLFVLALAAEMQQVPGRTTKTAERKWANTFLDSLAEEAVKAELAKDLDDALTLVIPAFARYDLLPKQYTEEEDASPSSAAASHVSENSPSIRQRRSGSTTGQSGTSEGSN